MTEWRNEFGKYYKIEADLDISEEMFTEYNPPYGSVCLYGYIDGQNHTIRVDHATDNDVILSRSNKVMYGGQRIILRGKVQVPHEHSCGDRVCIFRFVFRSPAITAQQIELPDYCV